MNIPTISTRESSNVTASIRRLRPGGPVLTTRLPDKTRPSTWVALTRQRSERPLIMTESVVCRAVSLLWFSKHQEDLLSESLKTQKPVGVWYGPGVWRYFQAVGSRFEIVQPTSLPEQWCSLSILSGDDTDSHRVTP